MNHLRRKHKETRFTNRAEIIDVSWIWNVDTLRRFVKVYSWEPAVVKLGLDEGFLDGKDVVSLELERYSELPALSQPEEALALLLSDAVEEVPSLLGRACEEASGLQDPLRVWMFVGLSQVREHWGQISEPWSTVSVLVDHLDAGEDYLALLPYWPAGGRPTGPAAMLSRLDERLAIDNATVNTSPLDLEKE